MLVSASIQSHFDYGSTYWFSALSYKLKAKLLTSQNKLIHFVLGKHNRSYVGSADLKDIDWLSIEHRVAQMKLALMYRIVNGTAPEHRRRNRRAGGHPPNYFVGGTE